MVCAKGGASCKLCRDTPTRRGLQVQATEELNERQDESKDRIEEKEENRIQEKNM